MRQSRIAALDGLRGIAALMVVSEHAAQTACISWMSARPVVILFFVLSGFVLALPWVDNQPPRWDEFLIRRFFRL